jgi:hypothetical protein
MDAVLSRLFHRGPAVRAALSLSTYSLFLYVLAVMVCWAPAHALAVSYARIATPAAQAVTLAAQRGAISTALGHAIAQASGTSVAVRLVTAGTGGWPVLGVLAGLTLLSVAFNNGQVAEIKHATAGPSGVSVDGVVVPQGTLHQCPGHPDCDASAAQGISIPTTYCLTGPPYPQVPAGWQGWFFKPSGCWAYPNQGSPPGVLVPGLPATPQQVTDYLTNLPSGDPNSIERNASPVGSGHTAPGGDSVTTIPIDATDLSTQVVPTAQVTPDDVVVNPNTAPPAGTQTTSSTSQQTTTTTTTTTNPDGSTTSQDDSTTTVHCSTGDHDQRSFGSILDEHLTTWKGSGLAGQLALLQSLTWPSDLPTIALNSSLFGNFSVNFNDWSGMFLALRAIVIAGAGFAAYRIIFVGNS